MAFSLNHSFKIAFLFVTSLHFCSCFNPKLLNVSEPENSSNWSFATGTWYGDPSGAGSDGGACGYGPSVEQPPFNKMIAATCPTLYRSGYYCGACFQVKCTENAACSGKPVTVTVTDECPGCPEAAHFDLSGTAFGAMAKPGQANQLRNAGTFQIQYKRVPCNYPGVHIAFSVQQGTNPYYMAIAIEFADKAGDLSAAGLKPADGSSWFPMQRLSGGVWSYRSDTPLKAPLSFKLTDALSHKTVVANNVIPANWQPGKTYRSVVNF